jgi:hypothetical protein
MEIILKKKILSIVAALTLIVSVSVVGFAGLSGRVSANIPFDFTVGNKEFKAGKYSVERLFASSASDTLIIRSADNSGAANFNVNRVSGKGGSHARLVFRRYDNQYFLAQVFDGEEARHNHAKRCRAGGGDGSGAERTVSAATSDPAIRRPIGKLNGTG